MIITLQDELPSVEGLLAGTDEAGRGPLAGNVVAAAVILDPLKPKKRERLYQAITQQALAWSVVSVCAQQIDEMNILQASLYAMRCAAEQLQPRPDHVFVDGNKTLNNCFCQTTAIIKGDSRS